LTTRGIGDEPEYILPLLEFQETVMQAFETKTIPKKRVGKRLADLRIAWSEPAGGATRYVIGDGNLPAQIARLATGEVPSQRFFIVDGDGAVPALFGSKVFAVWAQATLSRSTSWMSRFSVGRTFGAFPIFPPFFIQPSKSGPAQLRLSAVSPEFEVLVTQLSKIYRSPADRRDSFSQRLHRQIDNVILEEHLKLAHDATDYAILSRLLEIGKAH
jgi:hypothetical protein